MTILGEQLSKRRCKLPWGHSGRLQSILTGVLVRSGSLGTQTHQDAHTEGRGKRWQSRQPPTSQRESLRKEPADTTDTDFWPPELCESSILLPKPPTLESVRAAPANGYRERLSECHGDAHGHRRPPLLLGTSASSRTFIMCFYLSLSCALFS